MSILRYGAHLNMPFYESIFLDKPTVNISCDICDMSMYMNEIKELQHFPQTQRMICICSNCADKFNKINLQKFLDEKI